MRRISIDTVLAWFSVLLLFSGYAWILSDNRGIGFMDVMLTYLPFLREFRSEIFYGLYWLFTVLVVVVFIYLIIRTVQQLREKDKPSESGNLASLIQSVNDLIQEIRRDRDERNNKPSNQV